MRARHRRVGLTKTIEDERQEVAPDADAGVGDLELDCGVPARRPTVMVPLSPVNLSAFDSRFQNTCWSRCASPSNRRHVVERSSNRIRLACSAGRTHVDRARERSRATSTASIASVILPVMMRETSSTSSISRTCASALRSMTLTACAVLVVEVSCAQDPRPAEDRVERRPQLVRQRAQEFVLQPIGLLCLPIELDAIEGQPDSPRDVFEDERSRRPQARSVSGDERQDGLDAAVNDQRHDRRRGRVKALRVAERSCRLESAPSRCRPGPVRATRCR